MYSDINIVQKTPTDDVGFETGYLQSPSHKKLFWRMWRSKTEPPKALLVLQHGYAEHGDRYHHVASYLVRRGYLVFAVDAQGHGKSEGKRGYVRRWDDYVDDLDYAIAHAQEGCPDLPTCVLGHSNGGLIVLRHALLRPGRAKAYAVSSPFCGMIAHVPLSKRLAARLLAKVAPSVTIETGLQGDKISHVKEVVEDYQNDPSVFSTSTPRYYVETVAAQQDLMNRAGEIKAPFLFLVSSEDFFVDPKASEEIYHRLGSSHREFHLLPGMYHESFNEEGWQNSVEMVAEWFDRMLL